MNPPTITRVVRVLHCTLCWLVPRALVYAVHSIESVPHYVVFHAPLTVDSSSCHLSAYLLLSPFVDFRIK